MNRRNFMAGILAAGVAPAIVRAESLMRIVVPRTSLLVPAGVTLAGLMPDTMYTFRWQVTDGEYGCIPVSRSMQFTTSSDLVIASPDETVRRLINEDPFTPAGDYEWSVDSSVSFDRSQPILKLD